MNRQTDQGRDPEALTHTIMEKTIESIGYKKRREDTRMKKRGLAYILSAAMLLSVAAPAAVGAQETTLSLAGETQTEAGEAQSEAQEAQAGEENGDKNAARKVWETDIRMALTRESALRQEAGMSVWEWDDAVAAKKEEGKAASLTKEAVLDANPDSQILEKDGKAYFIDHADVLGEVKDGLDAYRAAYSAAALMGGNELADLRLWHQMEIGDVRFYSFQQISDSTMVIGSTIKVAVRDGRVLAVFSSLDPEMGKEEKRVTQSEAEDIVLDTLEAEGKKAEVFPEYTDRVFYNPTVLTDLNLDEADDDPVPEDLRWVVYSENEGDEEYPYTAHYLDLAGNYLENLTVREPGDEEARCGFRKQRVFDGMTADIWTGEIHGTDDKVKTVTLPIMRDEEGRLYLGDVERRIAVADFAKAVYDDAHELVLVQADDNAVFDNEDLYMYYNYLNAWVFYADMGWISPDGAASDVIILKDLCTSDGTLYENACSIGMIQGWQMFGYTAYDMTGVPLRLGYGLDVMAHEYTHTFTSILMNSNLYENDQGAINEAMSDIMGNLTEIILGETEDTRWLLGENTGMVIRSMSDPAAYQQPAYVWDEYYGPRTDIPNDCNDRGGVHYNSSLLNHIAARLCMDYGMEYEDAVRFWIMTACGLTPKTDYPQICAVMNWAIKESGNEPQAENLNQVINEEHLDRKEIPKKMPSNMKIVSLHLPDTETFEDEYWMMMTIQLNTNTIQNVSVAAVKMVMQLIKDGQDAEKIGLILSELLESIHLDGNKIRLEKKDDKDAVMDAVSETLLSSLSKLVELGIAWRMNVGEDILYVSDNDPTVYMLLNITESGTKVNGAVVLIGERWVDLSPFLKIGKKLDKMATSSGEIEVEMEPLLDVITSLTPEQWEALSDLAGAIKDVIHPDKKTETQSVEKSEIAEELLDLALALMKYKAADEETQKEGLLLPTKTQELPTEGLEKVKLQKE